MQVFAMSRANNDTPFKGFHRDRFVTGLRLIMAYGGKDDGARLLP
jgi:hypothetical protein